jgi:hypothetical protein
MSQSRLWLFLFIAGVAVGALPAPSPRARPAQAGEYVVLSGDFHVHAFPGDGALTPARLVDLAAEEGLDVITITNHNQVLASHILPRDSDPIVLLGEEVTNPDFHLIAVGVTDGVNWRQPAAGAIADIHAQGGVAIAAHPEQEFWAGWDEAAIAAVDGVEVAHPMLRESTQALAEFDEFLARVLAGNPGVARIGSSDYHVTHAPGQCRTFLFARERTRDGVLDAIRAGRTVAQRADGTLVGDPALVALVRTHHRTIPRPVSLLPTISAALAWLGIAGLMMSSRT